MAASRRSNSTGRRARKASQKLKTSTAKTSVPFTAKVPTKTRSLKKHNMTRRTDTRRELSAASSYHPRIEPGLVALLHKIGQPTRDLKPNALKAFQEYIDGLRQQSTIIDCKRFPFRTFEVFVVALLFAYQPDCYLEYVEAAKLRPTYTGGVAALINEYQAIFEDPVEMLAICKDICKMSELDRKPGECTLIENWIVMAYLMDQDSESLFKLDTQYAQLPTIDGMVLVLMNVYHDIINELLDPAFRLEDFYGGWQAEVMCDAPHEGRSAESGNAANESLSASVYPCGSTSPFDEDIDGTAACRLQLQEFDNVFITPSSP